MVTAYCSSRTAVVLLDVVRGSWRRVRLLCVCLRMVQGEDADWVFIAWVYIGLCSLAQSKERRHAFLGRWQVLLTL